MSGCLLVACDLTDRSLPPLARALALAAAVPGRRVALLHVLDAAPDRPPGSDAERAATEALHRILRQAAPPGAPAPEIMVRPGRPAAVVAAAARDCGADLVLMGVPRPRRLRDGFAATTVEQVIRAAAAPVLRARLPGAAAWRRVIVATDLSPTAARAFAAAAALGLFAGAQVEFVHAYRPQAWSTGGFGDADSTEIARAARAERAARLGGLRVHLAEAGGGAVAAQPVLVEGEAAEALVAHAAATGAGLIIAGTRGRSVLADLVLGSTARGLLARAPCDVLAVPPAAP
jgi:nucleotide-binding universal stress UspA family protein